MALPTLRMLAVIAVADNFFVMPGLVPGIHVFTAVKKEDVDGRDKPGHDEFLHPHRTQPLKMPAPLQPGQQDQARHCNHNADRKE
jgi:hypothetical protein